jgi:signal transduction histidine kinase
VRRRLILSIVAVAAAAVALFAIPLGVALNRSYRDEELLRLQRDTVAATRTIDLRGRDARNRVELPPSRDALAVYDRSGRRVAGRGPVHADAAVDAALRGASPADRASDGRLVAAVPLLSGEQVSGALRAQRSGAAASNDAHGAWLVLLAAGAGVIALAALAALVLGRRLARPTERLAIAAGRLGDGDFAARAPRSGVPELDAVAVALDATAERLDALVSRERAFSADASHQLRTPLAALRLELEALELRDGPCEELSAAQAQVERLQSTVETLLSVARDVPREHASIDLTAVAEAVAAHWREPLAQDGRSLHVVAEAPRVALPRAAASEPVVAEIVEVLMANAHRHGAGAVTVTIRRSGDALALDVADEGAGIAGEPEQIFARRGPRQPASIAVVEGHGIGLALARSLAHAEGGRLVLSRSGPAPVFTLWLPGSARST